MDLALLCGTRDRLRRELVRVVLTLRPWVAAWARPPISLGPTGSALVLLVIRPAEITSRTDPAEALAHPERLVRSALAHGQGPAAIDIAEAAARVVGRLDADRAGFHADLILSATLANARAVLEAALRQGYEHQSELARGPSFDGESEDELSCGQRPLLRLRAPRGSSMEDAVRQPIAASPSPEPLLDEVFALACAQWVGVLPVARRRRVARRPLDERFTADAPAPRGGSEVSARLWYAPSMRIVVTGGAGYIGSTLVPRLLAAGHQVHVVDSLLFGGEALLPHFIKPNFSFAQVDVTDRPALARQLEGADGVVHLAALVGYPLCKKLPRQAREVNVDGARNVAELAPPSARMVYASTGSNYGEVIGICTEDTPLNPLSLYGETKTEAEALMRARPNSVALRFATAFGTSHRMRLDLMINDFAWQAIHRKYLVVYESQFRRTFLHVHDIARAIEHALTHWDRLHHDVYNVGHDSLNYTKADIVGLLRQRLDFLVYFAEFGKDEDRRDYEVDYSRIRASGFEAEVDIERGLGELVAALRLLPLRNPYSNV